MKIFRSDPPQPPHTWNLQLHRVVSDVTGVTGLRIIRAIPDGQRDPEQLSTLRDFRIKTSQATIAKALVGDYRPEHLFALRQAVELYDFYSSKIDECDRQVEAYLRQLDSRVDPTVVPMPPSTRTSKSKKPQRNQAIFDLRTEVYRISGVDFTQIEGLDSLTVQTVLSEIGLDPGRFPTCKRFTSWLCLCPDNRITGGKIKSSKTRPSANRAARAVRLAAQVLSNSQGPLFFLPSFEITPGRPQSDHRPGAQAGPHLLPTLVEPRGLRPTTPVLLRENERGKNPPIPPEKSPLHGL